MQDASEIQPEQPAVDERNVALPMRNDTMLGICQGLGEDLGIHPNLLRVMFGAIVFFDVKLAVIAYLTVGVFVAASRYFFPKPKTTAIEDHAALADAANSEVEYQVAA
ncbi:PspC domain-containing protein [Sphingomonas sinipercae]|uniref:PspC domain-containing protein n=1 Tax=Sphingomonas sinipercae TaxID=2714944 RepID=A0A6G7ZP40_9SPHN|nr:PspC domain-containing protein [Sphingomonas sinipercae]QIL02703.1 PspC domain-containing protein [Sphingomonas sinipercae]